MPALASGILGNSWVTIAVAFAIILVLRFIVELARRRNRESD